MIPALSTLTSSPASWREAPRPDDMEEWSAMAENVSEQACNDVRTARCATVNASSACLRAASMRDTRAQASTVLRDKTYTTRTQRTGLSRRHNPGETCGTGLAGVDVITRRARLSARKVFAKLTRPKRADHVGWWNKGRRRIVAMQTVCGLFMCLFLLLDEVSR